MTFAAPRRSGIAALALGLLSALSLPALVLAEDAPAGRTWTDPPAREPAAVTAEAPKTSDAAPRSAPTASVARPGRAPRVAHRPPVRRVKVAARPVETHPSAAAVRPRARIAAPAPRIRTVTMRPATYAPPPPGFRYGYVVEPVPARPILFGGSRMFEDDRMRRVRQAEEAGYLVVRSRRVEFPDGRRLRTYRPLDDDAED